MRFKTCFVFQFTTKIEILICLFLLQYQGNTKYSNHDKKSCYVLNIMCGFVLICVSYFN